MKKLKATKDVVLSSKLRENFSYKTASMGNFFYVNFSDKISFYSSTEKVWPGKAIKNDFGSGDTYSKSSNQSALWVNFNLNLPKNHDFKFIGGLLTVFNKKKYNRNNIVKCTWFVQTRGFELKQIDGFIYKEHHITAKNELDALSKIKKIREKSAKILFTKRIFQNIDLKRIWVTFEDSIKAGNCVSGTKNFAGKNNIDIENIGAVRADYLLEIANGNITFVNRAIAFAKMRYAELSLK